MQSILSCKLALWLHYKNDGQVFTTSKIFWSSWLNILHIIELHLLGAAILSLIHENFSWKVADIQVIANDRYLGRPCTYPDVVMAWGAIPEREVVPNMHVGSLVEISSIILSQPHVFPLHNQPLTFRIMFSVPKTQRRQCTSWRGMTVVSLKGQSYSCK
jgi:hypothetical protein